jgi:hypothetical protein
MIHELRTGLNSGRGGGPRLATGYDGNNPRFAGLGINAKKFGGPQRVVGERNYSSSARGIAKPGTY